MFWKRKKKKKAEAITQENFEQKNRENKRLFIFFAAPWCPACKILKPIIHELAHENQEHTLVGIVDADTEPELTASFQIRSLPSLVVVHNRDLVYQGSGMISKPRLQEMIDNLLS